MTDPTALLVADAADGLVVAHPVHAIARRFPDIAACHLHDTSFSVRDTRLSHTGLCCYAGSLVRSSGSGRSGLEPGERLGQHQTSCLKRFWNNVCVGQ